MYKSCEICGADNWDLVVYEGAVRSGSFGTAVRRAVGFYAVAVSVQTALMKK